MNSYNGLSYYAKTLQQEEIVHVDASLTGLGAVWQNQVYATPLFHSARCLVIALKVWGFQWRDR